MIRGISTLFRKVFVNAPPANRIQPISEPSVLAAGFQNLELYDNIFGGIPSSSSSSPMLFSPVLSSGTTKQSGGKKRSIKIGNGNSKSCYLQKTHKPTKLEIKSQSSNFELSKNELMKRGLNFPLNQPVKTNALKLKRYLEKKITKLNDRNLDEEIYRYNEDKFNDFNDYKYEFSF